MDPDKNILPYGTHRFVLAQANDAWLRECMALWRSDSVSDELLATAMSSVARVVHLVLDGIPADEKTIQAMVWLLCEYAHGALGVPEQIDLQAHLLQAARGEPALHVLRSFYRDHFFHTMEVCFLGHFLLELQAQPRRRLWQLVADKLRLRGTRDAKHQRVLRLWYVASLLHDVGYGIDVLKGVRSLLRFFGNTPPLGDLVNHLDQDFTRLSADLEGLGLALYSSAEKPGEDHGVIAAWHLEKLLDRAAKMDATLDPRHYRPAIRAIAMHNSRKDAVRFADDPLAFLLILCDTIQEWNRLRLAFGTSPHHILSRLTDSGAFNGHVRGPLEKVSLNVTRLRGTQGFGLNRVARPLRFTLEFNEEIRWNAGVFELWLDSSCNLQRLNFEGLPSNLDIEIEYRTPLFCREAGAEPEAQLHRLRDAAQETHMTFLERWFPKRQEGTTVTNGAVTWASSDAAFPRAQREILTLHLRELSRQKLVTAGMDEFRDRLARWRRFNEDREFAGDYAAPEAVP